MWNIVGPMLPMLVCCVKQTVLLAFISRMKTFSCTERSVQWYYLGHVHGHKHK